MTTGKLFRLPPPTNGPDGQGAQMRMAERPAVPGRRHTPPEFKKMEHAETGTGEIVITNPGVPVTMVRPDAGKGKVVEPGKGEKPVDACKDDIPIDVGPVEERKPVQGTELQPESVAALVKAAESRSSCFDPVEFAQGIKRAFRCTEGEKNNGASYISIEMDNGDRFRIYSQQANLASVEKGEMCKEAANLMARGELLTLYREMPELEAEPIAAMLKSAENFRPTFVLADMVRRIRRAFRFGEGERGTGAQYILIIAEDASKYRLYGSEANMASVEKWEKCRLNAELKIEGKMHFLYWEPPPLKPRE